MAQTIINFCPQCGSGISSTRKFSKQRPYCPECGWIYFSDPKVASAVLIQKEGKILLVRRKNTPEKGKWTLPAGFVDKGEDPVKAAERECLEETGLKVEVTHLIDVIHGLEHTRGADIVIVYGAIIIDGSINPLDDVDMVEWFSPNNMPELAFEATKKILNSPDLYHRSTS